MNLASTKSYKLLNWQQQRTDLKTLRSIFSWRESIINTPSIIHTLRPSVSSWHLSIHLDFSGSLVGKLKYPILFPSLKKLPWLGQCGTQQVRLSCPYRMIFVSPSILLPEGIKSRYTNPVLNFCMQKSAALLWLQTELNKYGLHSHIIECDGICQSGNKFSGTENVLNWKNLHKTKQALQWTGLNIPILPCHEL